MKLNYAKAHKRLWLWLADNPTKGKEDWPEWKYNGGKIPSVTLNCFACGIDEQYFCPLHGKFCSIWGDNGCFSLYEEWRVAYIHNATKLATELAIQIANLKWHGPQMKEI